MSDYRENCKIYIIESQKDSDILNKRTEGKALSATLDLAHIPNMYYQVVTVEMLEECFKQICLDISYYRFEGLVIPYLHFSAHGNDTGIILTDNTFIDWEKMRKYIDVINTNIGFIRPKPDNPKLLVSILNLSFSTCKGIYAHNIQGDLSDNKYVCLIGPTDAVDWSDSLIAFSTFYHQIFYKHKKANDAINNMNAAAGLDSIFQISMGFGLKLSD